MPDSKDIMKTRAYPENAYGGFTRCDSTVAFYGRVNALVGSETDVLDVGCGIGGSTRHIARKYGADGVGITLSPVQAARAGGPGAALRCACSSPRRTSRLIAPHSTGARGRRPAFAYAPLTAAASAALPGGWRMTGCS